MKNKIFYKPAIQVENIGDMLINLVELELLRPFGQVIIDDSATPAWFVDEISNGHDDLRLSQISDKPLVETLKSELEKQKNSTGEKFNYYMVIQPGHTSRSGARRAFRHFKMNLAYHNLKSLGCKIIRMGFSIGPFDVFNGLSESFASHAYAYYAVRDKESLKIAQQYKFLNPQYFPDLAWAYKPPKPEVSSDKKYVVVSMRSNAYGEKHDSAYLAPLLERLHTLLSSFEKGSFKLVVAYQVKYDREPSIEIFEKLKNEFEVELIDHKLSLKEAIGLYGGADCVISNRLHVLLLAMKCGTVSFGLADRVDNKKITSIFSDNQLDDLILDTKVDASESIAKLNKVLANKEETMAGFRRLQQSNYQTIQEKLATVF